MDSLTQIVLGAAVGEATLGKKIGSKALLYGAIAGTIPDLDVLFGKLTDTITAIEWHRAFSHSLLFCVIVGCFLGWLVNKIERKANLGWKPWSKLFFLGLFTHALLDAFTSWGTQILWPIQTRFALSSIFVIDPIYTLPFLGCTIAVLFYKRDSKIRRRINRVGLSISTLYLLISLFVKIVAEQQFIKALEQQNITYSKISIRPSPLNIILWNANIDTPDAYLIADYSFFDSQPITFKIYPKKHNIASKLMKYKNIQRLISISEGWYIIEQINNQWIFNDLRFGLIDRKDGSSFFSFSYLLEIENEAITATETIKTGRDAQFLMQCLWQRLKGN
ncbi:metal-dependent hydrolase [Pontimicrobium sp. IMCC45349]|uniref:metal-dependent hydrolase n=1 Tax=Pontimicrobium sp. IMCC45349 TaxID=3391574 RepID=UPI0039A375F4